MDLVLVGVGGFFGAIARRSLDLAISEGVEGAFPYGTLVINLSGSFLLGLLFAWAIERDVLSADLRGPLMIGFLGAYTTFSTFEMETFRAIADGAWLVGGLNVVGSVLAGYLALWLGVMLTRLV